MSILSSKFDIVSVDNPVALASLAQVLEVGPVTYNANGTPVAGTIPAGSIVEIDTATGKAVLAQSNNISTAGALLGLRKLVFVTVDGNTDYSGSWVQKLTCLHGGVTIVTDQIVANAGFAPGKPVTFGTTAPNAGKVELMTDKGTQQLLGFVGPNGYKAASGSTPATLEVILPQGAGI